MAQWVFLGHETAWWNCRSWGSSKRTEWDRDWLSDYRLGWVPKWPQLWSCSCKHPFFGANDCVIHGIFPAPSLCEANFRQEAGAFLVQFLEAMCVWTSGMASHSLTLESDPKVRTNQAALERLGISRATQCWQGRVGRCKEYDGYCMMIIMSLH